MRWDMFLIGVWMLPIARLLDGRPMRPTSAIVITLAVVVWLMVRGRK